jgi:hypothetical protein
VRDADLRHHAERIAAYTGISRVVGALGVIRAAAVASETAVTGLVLVDKFAFSPANIQVSAQIADRDADGVLRAGGDFLAAGEATDRVGGEAAGCECG